MWSIMNYLERIGVVLWIEFGISSRHMDRPMPVHYKLVFNKMASSSSELFLSKLLKKTLDVFRDSMQKQFTR